MVGRSGRYRKTGTKIKDIGEFFQGREIDGKKVYGLGIYTERGSEGITMGVTAAMYSLGVSVMTIRNKPYHMDGYRQQRGSSAEALEFYKSAVSSAVPRPDIPMLIWWRI